MTARGWTIVSIIAVILGLIGYAAWALFDYGRYRAGFDTVKAHKVERELHLQIDLLEDQLDEFRSRVARLESAKKVDLYANNAVKDTLAKMEAEYQELREELQFYRTIVTPGKGREGLHIHDINISQIGDDRFAYTLTLIHIQGTKKHHRQSDGEVRIAVSGKQDGINKKLGFATISTEKKAKIRYRFKYFARYEGQLKFPKKFVPETIEIDVTPRQRNIKGDSKIIKWPGKAT